MQRSASRSVHLIVPEGIDDPLRPSGGNVYDQRIRDGLRAAGWTVVEHEVAGRWPKPEPTSSAALAGAIAAVPDGAVALVDGLLASASPGVIVPASHRMRLVVLLHMPLGSLEIDGVSDLREREHSVLAAADAVITTSQCTRDLLVAHYDLDPRSVHTAPPGVDASDLTVGSESGARLLCVAAITPGKGHDVLLAALAELDDLAWTCCCVGPLHLDLAFVDRLSEYAVANSLDSRLRFTGPLVGPELDAAFASSDLLVLPSRAETYGMVVAEALARGIPVIASDVGGVPEALGTTGDGRSPGLLVRPDDAVALAAALRRWLVDPGLRVALRELASARRNTLSDWSATSRLVADVLSQLDGGIPGQPVEPRGTAGRSPNQSALIGASDRV